MSVLLLKTEMSAAYLRLYSVLSDTNGGMILEMYSGAKWSATTSRSVIPNFNCDPEQEDRRIFRMSYGRQCNAFSK